MKFELIKMTLWFSAGMQPHFQGEITQVMGHHTQPEGIFCSTHHLWHRCTHGIIASWVIQVKFGGNQILTIVGTLIAGLFLGQWLNWPNTVYLHAILLKWYPFVTRTPYHQKNTQFGALFGQIQCASAWKVGFTPRPIRHVHPNWHLSRNERCRGCGPTGL